MGNILCKEDIIDNIFVMTNNKYNVFDTMIEGVQIIDYNWRYFYANDSLAKQGLTTIDKMIGQTMMSVYPGIENTEVFDFLRSTMEDRIAIETQTEFSFPDGSKGWFELSIQPVPEGIIILSSDITKLKNAEAELKKKLTERTQILSQISKQKKQLEEFCQIIAHNLRAPLSNLSLLSEMVKESKSTKDKLHYMEIQKPVIDLLHNTFEELINATQVRMDYTIKKSMVDLEKCTQKIILQFQDDIIESNATLTYDFSEAAMLFYPKKYIDNIIKNLLSNALRYKSLERNPKIHIRSYKNNGWFYIEVKDNGLGIDLKKHKDNLFKLHKTFHNHPKARGFGLFITKVQVEAMGGNISVKSIPDKGSLFTVKLYKMSTDEKN